MKHAYNKAVHDFQQENFNVIVNKKTFPAIFKMAFQKVMKPQNTMKAFLNSGIFPFDTKNIKWDKLAQQPGHRMAAPPAEPIEHITPVQHWTDVNFSPTKTFDINMKFSPADGALRIMANRKLKRAASMATRVEELFPMTEVDAQVEEEMQTLSEAAAQTAIDDVDRTLALLGEMDAGTVPFPDTTTTSQGAE